MTFFKWLLKPFRKEEMPPEFCDISASLTAFAEAHPEVLKRSKEIGERWMRESRAS